MKTQKENHVACKIPQNWDCDEIGSLNLGLIHQCAKVFTICNETQTVASHNPSKQLNISLHTKIEQDIFSLIINNSSY